MRNTCIAFGASLILAACGAVTDKNTSKGSEPQVVGGWEVEDSSPAPITRESTVALTTAQRASQGLIFCSGTLVSPRVVVTAAHCLSDERGNARLPTEELRVAFDVDVTGRSKLVSVSKAMVHPGYDPGATVSPNPDKAPNDIAVMILSEDAPEGYKPAILNTETLTNRFKLLVAGFGASFSGMFSKPGRLRAAWLNFTRVDENLSRIETSNFMRSACSGDSGGPLYAENPEGKYVLVGVVSAGTQFLTVCTGKNLFTSVSHYVGWIRESTANP